MPYIAKTEQQGFENLLKEIHSHKITTAGQLNFLLTVVALKYMLDNSDKVNGVPHLRYEQMNAVVGAFDNAKDEFQRRVQHPYETQKAFEAAQQNADPFDVLN